MGGYRHSGISTPLPRELPLRINLCLNVGIKVLRNLTMKRDKKLWISQEIRNPKGCFSPRLLGNNEKN